MRHSPSVISGCHAFPPEWQGLRGGGVERLAADGAGGGSVRGVYNAGGVGGGECRRGDRTGGRVPGGGTVGGDGAGGRGWVGEDCAGGHI